MASRIEIFEVTVSAGTAIASPSVTATEMDTGIVDRVEILIPPGPSGLVGFQILHSNVPVIPRETDRFIVADNEVIKWDLANMPTGGMWGIRAYNLDVFDHTLYFRFLVTETPGMIPATMPAIPVEPPDEQVPTNEGNTDAIPEFDLGPLPEPEGEQS